MLTELPPRHRPDHLRAACVILDAQDRILLTEPQSADEQAGLPWAVVPPGTTVRGIAADVARRACRERVTAARLHYLTELHLPPGPRGEAPYDLRVFVHQHRGTAPGTAPGPKLRWRSVESAAAAAAGLDPASAHCVGELRRLHPSDAEDGRIHAVAGIEDETRRLIDPVPALWRKDAAARVVVIGPPAVGKSTLLRRHTATAPETRHVRDIVPVSRSRGPGPDNYLTRYLRGDDASGFFCQMETLLLRVLQNLRTDDTGVMDQDVPSSLAYAKALRLSGTLTAQQYETYYRYHHLITSALPPPRAVVHLTARTDVLMRRLRRRNRVLERSFTPSYVSLVAQCFEDVAEELAARIPVHHLDTSDMNPAQVLARFEELLPARTGPASRRSN
ncbi:deoxynucleoside kinase [Kitasatospora sp. SUK 42]|uniref:deoxynucleoside kinase n=1 Tax=Kitasatospora sp. SUK 42 TaxID=1588882 RepID=UPI0018C99474|nr:deoxynucleoside kinase [Kitasatospora sp. SUK 42]MBV2154893.1 deoxynucleoside kinase [Kitasatospora sp. SUK 42]